MKKIAGPEHKHIMLQILDSIDEYCRKKNIKYFMSGGTLLGAVRHKGFIPWDDDLDIGMLREDYEKFISSYIDPNGIYRLICFEKNDKYHLPFAKVIDTRTELVEEVSDSIPLGVYVDIFPYDNLPAEYSEAYKYVSKFRKYDLLLSVKNTPIKKRRSMLKNIILVFAKASSAMFKRSSIIKKIIKKSREYSDFDSAEYVGQLAIMQNGNKSIIKKDWVKSLCTLRFEERNYYAPLYYDEYLSSLFGDYMKYPPKEERHPHHKMRTWWKENPYNNGKYEIADNKTCNGNPKISVIVPVYNVEGYLEQCIDSLISQTFNEIEIILIDDGSTDSSGAICDRYAAKDQRIVVIHKKNEGLSIARNLGIDKSRAPYILFVDSDDWVEPDFCEKPLKAAKKSNADIVFFLYNGIHGDGRIIKADFIKKDGMASKEEAFDINVFNTSVVWMGMYKRELFENIRFPEKKYYEDLGTTHRLIYAADRIYMITDCILDHRFSRPDSITKSIKTREHPDRKEMFIQRANDYYLWGYKDYAWKCAISILVKYGWKENDMKPFVKMVKELKCNLPANVTWKHKALYVIFRISPYLFDTVCKLTGERRI